ncbi:MAG: hypothetical protein ACI8X5_001040 [Planctomycetota bacterium]
MNKQADSPGPDLEAARKKRRKARLATLLKTLLAALLLAWVANGLPWTDTLRYIADPNKGAEVLSISGTILGGWRENVVEFDVDATNSLDAAWPEDLRLAVQAGENLNLSRRGGDVAGYEWRPGMPRVFYDLHGSGLVAAFAGLLLGLFFGVTRWWRILRLANCPSSWWNTLRFSSLGLFFNLVMPGLTGGDLPKALMVVRAHPERRADALATVVIDRLIGLWSLVLLACSVVWWRAGDWVVLQLPVTLALVAMSMGMIFVLLPGPRRVLGFDRLIAKLPQAARIQKLEQSALLYRGRPGELVISILLSLGNHISVVAAVYAIGTAFGTLLGFGAYVGVVSVANLITALPLSPGGWGVGEAAYGYLFEQMGAVATIGVAVSVTYRLCTVALGLAGGLFMMMPGTAKMRDEVMRPDGDQ